MAHGSNNINFQINFNKGETKALDALKADINEIRRLASDLNFTSGMDPKKIQKMVSAANTLETSLTRAYDLDLNTINVQKFNQLLAQSGMTVKTLQKDLSAAGVTGQQAFLKMTGQMMQFNQATVHTSKFLDNISSSLFNTVKYTAFNAILNSISGTIQHAYSYVKELDSSLNDIRIVTGKSADEMERFAEQANDAAKNLAVTTSQYTEGSLIYYQQGLDDDTVKALTDITAKTSNVTQQSMSTVSEQLTAVQNGYKVANQAAEEGMGIYEEYVDKMAAVGASTASNLEELSTAMSKVASAASSMGVGFDDLNAQIATIVSVTRQAPESVGTALKTIYARLGDLKVDGVDEFGTKLGDVSKQLQTMGINIIDQTGNMRNMSDVIAEVAQKQDTWTSAQKQAAAVAMAGKRQYNNLVALFDNQDMYGEALETSMNAAGTLEKQQEIAMDSLANKMDVLKATAEDLYDSLFDVDTMKDFVGAGTNVLQFFADFADAIGGLNNLIPMLGSIGLQVFSDQIGRGIGNLILNFQNAISYQNLMKENFEQLSMIYSDSTLFAADKSAPGDPQLAQAIATETSKIYEYYKQMYPYQSMMTQEQKEQYDTILNTKIKIGELGVEIEKQGELFNKQINYLGIIDKDVVNNLDDTAKVTKEVERINKVITDLESRLYSVDGLADDFTLEGFFTKNEVAEGNVALQKMNNEFNSLKKTTGDSYAAMEAFLNKVRGIKNNLDGLVQANNRMNSLKNSSDQAAESLFKIVDTQKIVSNISNVTGAIGQLSMSLNTLINLGNIQKNEDIDLGDKLLQTFMNLSFVIPGLIKGLSSLGQTFGITTGLIGTLQASQAKTAAISTLNASGYELEKNALKGKTAAEIEDLLILKYIEKNNITHEGQLITDISLLGDDARAQVLNSIAKETNDGITKKLTVSQEALNTSMLASPIFQVIAGLTALIATVTIVTNIIDSQREATKKYNEEEIEKIKKIQEEIDTNNKLLDSYNKTLKTYKEAGDNKKELYNATLELIEAYDIENGILLLQAERYEDIAAAAKKAKNEALKQDIVNSERAGAALAENAAIDVADGTFDNSMIRSNGELVTSMTENLGLYIPGSDEQTSLKLIQGIIGAKENNSLGDAGLTFHADTRDLRSVYQYMQDINDSVEILEATYTKAQLSENSLYQDLKEEQSQYLEYLPQVEEQIGRIYSAEAQLAFTDFNISDFYDNNDNIKLEELNNEIIKIRENLSKKIPKDEVDKYINDVLIDVEGVSRASIETINSINNYLKKKKFTLITDEDKDQAEKDVQEIINKLDESQLNYLALHLNTIPLDTDLEQQIEDHKDVLIYYERKSVNSTLEGTISEFDAKKKNGFDQSAIDNLYTDQATEKTLGMSQDQFEVLDMAQQLDVVTVSYIENTKAIEENRQATEAALRKNFEDAAALKEAQQGHEMTDAVIEQTNQFEQLEGKSGELLEIFDKIGHGEKDLTASQKGLLVSYKALTGVDLEYIETLSKNIAYTNDVNNAYDQYLAELNSIEAETLNHKKNLEMLNEVMKNHNAVLDSVQATYKELMTMIDDFNETGHQTIDNVQKLMEMSDEYVATLNIQENSVSINEKAFQNLTIAKINDLRQTALNIYYEELLKISEMEAGEAAARAGAAAILAGNDFETMGGQALKAADDLLALADAFRASLNLEGDANKSALADQARKALENRLRAADDAMGEVKKGGNSMRKAMGAEKKSSKSGSKKDKDKDQKEQEDEFDRYWEIKKAIEAVDNALKKLDKDQENLYGYELIASLKQENELLEQQAANYERLYEMQQQEAAELRDQLGTMGLMFDASGAITNYAEATSAALAQYAAAIEQYNAGLMDETTLKVYEKSYENFKKLLDRYDKLYYTEMQNTQDKLDEIRRKELANNLKAWEVEIQIHLDKEKMKRDWNDFLKDIKQDFRKVFSDLTIDVKYDEKNFKSFVNDVGTTLKAVGDVEAEIDKMMGGGSSDMFESVSQAQEKLKELQEQLLDQGKSLRELYKQVQETYLNGIDQVKDKFEELMKIYERFNNELEYHRQLIELLYGDKAYDLMDKYYEAQSKNINAQIDSLRKQTDMWKDEFQKSYEFAIKSGSKVDINDFTTQTEDMKKAYENMLESQQNLNDLVLEGVKILQDQYLNTINKIMDAMDKAVQGKDGFEGMKSNQEFMQKMAEEYLDDVEGAAKIQTFANQMDMDKANASSLKAQQKIQAFREKEIQALREKENLTQADIDLAEARYQLMLKEIALEDAQNNKTSMKLTRNEQGNQSYQYVADEDDTAQKQQDLLQQYSDLYKLADDSYNHAMELSMDLYEEYIEKLRTIYEDTTLTEEERNQKIMELQEQYLPQIEAAVQNSELYKQEAMMASAGVFQTVCEQDSIAYNTLTEEQKRLVDELKEKHFEDYDDMRTHLIDEFYPDLNEIAKEVFNDLNINSQTTAAQVIGDQAKDSDSVKNEINKAISAMQKAIQDYEKELDKLQEVAGIDFSQVGNYIDQVSQKIDDMNGTTEKMVSDSSSYLDELRRVLDGVAQAQDSVIQQILDAQRAIQEYLALMGQANRASAPNYSSPSNGGGLPDVTGNGGGDGSKSPGGKAVTLVSNKVISETADGQWQEELTYSDNTKERRRTQSSFMTHIGDVKGTFASGGYTGQQNNGDTNGRLAFLHQKELVLNADDTKNFLSGINIIRDMTSLNGSISNAITTAVANMVLSLSKVNARTEPSTIDHKADAAPNIFNITAEFPNANDVNEIREAILSLPNLASQRVGYNLR